jgi:hypothetical protein
VQSFSFSADGTLSVVRTSSQDTLLTRAIVNPSNAPIPASLLACVGEVITPTEFGSGTLLLQGADRYVLTALHVVADYVDSPQAITFQLPAGSGFDGAGPLRVKRVVRGPWDPVSQQYEDLALLELSSPVPHVQGAALPGLSSAFYAGVGQPVVQVGYGLTTGGTSGMELYGRTQVAAVTTLAEGPGTFLVYNADPGQSAIAEGDSGGPDFTWLKQTITDRSKPNYGAVYYFPVVLGVHDLGPKDSPNYSTGDQTYSLAITDSVVHWILSNANPFA